jgi:hypothetical protein
MALIEFRVEYRGIPHLAKNERDAPNFLYAAPDRAAYAPFFKERRMRFAGSTKLHRKSGMWGTRASGARTGGRSFLSRLASASRLLGMRKGASGFQSGSAARIPDLRSEAWGILGLLLMLLHALPLDPRGPDSYSFHPVFHPVKRVTP